MTPQTLTHLIADIVRAPSLDRLAARYGRFVHHAADHPGLAEWGAVFDAVDARLQQLQGPAQADSSRTGHQPARGGGVFPEFADGMYASPQPHD